MLKIFTGNDRIRANQQINTFLGSDHEVIEGSDLDPADMSSIFYGTSLFASTRRILIRDLSANKPAFDKLPDYLDTPHDVALLELKLDKRSSAYKAIKDQVEIHEFKLPENPNFRLVFDIYKTAKTNGPRAVQNLAKIKSTEDPIMFFGLLASQAIKDYSARQGIKERRILSELAHTDLQMKTTPIDPWLLIESLLLRLGSL